MKLSNLTVAANAFGRVVGMVAGVHLCIAGAFAVAVAAITLIFESARLMVLLGWYFLLIPAGVLAAVMLAFVWLKRQGAFFDKERNSEKQWTRISTRNLSR